MFLNLIPTQKKEPYRAQMLPNYKNVTIPKHVSKIMPLSPKLIRKIARGLQKVDPITTDDINFLL